MGLMFFPRGGSAHVARGLARALAGRWDVTLLAGSCPGEGDAARFYAGLDVHPVRFDDDVPFQPSYEDRPGARARVFACLDDAELELHVAAWERQLRAAGAADADVLHLHHLT